MNVTIITSQHEGNKLLAMLNQGEFSTRLCLHLWKYGYDSCRSLLDTVTLVDNCPSVCRWLSVYTYRQEKHCTVVKTNFAIICLSKNVLDHVFSWYILRNAVVVVDILVFLWTSWCCLFLLLKPLEKLPEKLSVPGTKISWSSVF